MVIMKPQKVIILVVAVLTVYQLTDRGRVSGQELQLDIPQIDLRALGLLGEPVIPWVVNAGNIISEGDLVSGASIARQMLGVDGTGITVGVISDSFARNGMNIGEIRARVGPTLRGSSESHVADDCHAAVWINLRIRGTRIPLELWVKTNERTRPQ